MSDEPTLRGLTWDHPRGYTALEAAEQLQRDAGQALLQWDRQPLEGFESRPIGELARDYDLLVMDHPHVGEAVADDCLVPLEDLFLAERIAAWGAQSVGRAMQSYHWAGRHWALPLDVATQVMASRPDLLGEPPPPDWDSVIRLSERRKVALALAGPHALLHLFALCAALGEEPGGADLVSNPVGFAAWRILQRLHARVPPGTTGLNPIGLLEAMAQTDAIALVPLTFGYVTYAAGAPGRQAVAFDEAPLAIPGGRHGSVLGGTGIAVTRRARVSAALLDHLAWLLSPAVQRGFIPDHAGQPSALVAWQDGRLDREWGGFYRRTAATVADAMLRPRHVGFVAFQNHAAALVRAALHEAAGPAAVLGQLRAAWQTSLPAASREMP